MTERDEAAVAAVAFQALLSPAEARFFALYCQGNDYAAIAARLGVTLHRVETLASRVRHRLLAAAAEHERRVEEQAVWDRLRRLRVTPEPARATTTEGWERA